MTSLHGITILLLVVPGAPQRKNDTDLTKMQGNWEIISCTTFGNKVPQEDLTKASATIRENAIQFNSFPIVHSKTERQTIALGSTFSVNSKASPQSLDMENSVINLPVFHKAIYKLDVDRLLICFFSGERPKQFQSNETNILVELRRAKR